MIMSNKSVTADAANGQFTTTAASASAPESRNCMQNKNGHNHDSNSSNNHHDHDALCGPDSSSRRAHIRQRLALQGCAAVDEILSHNKNMCVEDVMIIAARGNMVDVVTYCVESKGADATKLVDQSIDDNDTTSGDHRDLVWMDCLLAAVEEGSSHVVQYLLSKGGANANSHSQKPLGQPSVAAVWAAAQNGHVYIIKLLLQHGADVNACRPNTGNTALYVAAQNGHALACSVLIQHGADLNLSRKQPRPVPPLGIVIGTARPDIMALLLNAGASLPSLTLSIWRQVLERKESTNIPYQRPLREDVLYQIKALVEQATECTLLNRTNQQVKKHYQRARKLEFKGEYRKALRAMVEAHAAYLEFNKYQEPMQLKPSPPAWVQLKLDGERLTNYVYGCKGSDGRVSKWKRHVFYKDDVQPPKLYHYTAVYYAPHQKIYRCGGMKMELMHVPTEEYPLWAFDVNRKQWAVISTTGQSPGLRARHVAALLGPYIYVFGGSTGLMQLDNKLFRLNLESKVWELVKVNQGSVAPMARKHAAMCAYEGKLYVMGGEQKGIPFDDLWQFNPKNNKWKELRPAPGSTVQPLDRHVHGMWACQNKLYVFGGQGLVPNATHPHNVEQAWSNLQCFDLETRHWNSIPNVGDFTWNFAEFLTLPLYRGQSEPSAVLLWGGYHDKTNEDTWASHRVGGSDDMASLKALYGGEITDYGMPYRRRLLRFDCETQTWTNLKLLDPDIVMPTATCWGAELWDESSPDDGLTRIMVGGGYGLTHNYQKQKEYTAEEKITYERLGIGKLSMGGENSAHPEISEQVYQVEILDERDYCAADQALQNQGWAWKLFTMPISLQPGWDGKIGFGSPNCFRDIDYCDQDFLDPPCRSTEMIAAGASKWASIQDDDASLLGRRLVLKLLQAKPELNGIVCRCGTFNMKTQRYQVFLEPRQGIDGVASMAVKTRNLEHADPLDANDFHSILTDQQGEKPTPVVAAVWLSDKRYATIDTRPHNLARFIEDAKTDSGEPYHFADSYKGPFSSAGRAILHAVGEVNTRTRGTISLCHFPKHRMDIAKRAKAGVAYDTLTSWVRQVHERDAERSKSFQQRIVAHRKATRWEMDKTKAKWLRVDVELDGIEPAITRSIIVSPLISIHRLHHQVLAPVFGRQSNIHCYAFRQCHKFSFPGQGTERAESSWKDQVSRHLELVHANWIGPKASSALDGFFQPFYIGGEMADDQKIMLGDLFYQGDHDTEEMYIRYIHDFGDWWSHTLTVTRYSGAVPPDASAVAHVLAGCGTCPPEDCGGITEYIKKIQQLTGVVHVKDDFDEVEPDDKILVHPLTEMWWKTVNSMRQRTGFRANLNQPIDFDLETTRRNLEEALRQRLEKPGLECLQLVFKNFMSALPTIPSEAGGSGPGVLKQTKSPKEMCAVCGVTAALQMCSGCGQVAYCGREHQLMHWKEQHKIECKKAQAAKKASS